MPELPRSLWLTLYLRASRYHTSQVGPYPLPRRTCSSNRLIHHVTIDVTRDRYREQHPGNHGTGDHCLGDVSVSSTFQLGVQATLVLHKDKDATLRRYTISSTQNPTSPPTLTDLLVGGSLGCHQPWWLSAGTQRSKGSCHSPHFTQADDLAPNPTQSMLGEWTEFFYSKG